MKGFFRALAAMRYSLLAWLGFSAFGLVSMGMQGYVLYYFVYPVLAPFYGHPGTWAGPEVWPMIIMAGMLWALSFLVAGVLNYRLSRKGWPKGKRKLVYLLVLWLGALLAWWVTLLANTGS